MRRLAVRLHHAPNARNHEFSSAALGFFHCRLVQLFEKESDLLLRCAELVGDVGNKLRPAQWFSRYCVFGSAMPL
jgi:hypothetical protein